MDRNVQSHKQNVYVPVLLVQFHIHWLSRTNFNLNGELMAENHMKPNHLKRYLWRFFSGMGAYVVLLVLALILAKPMDAGVPHVLVGLLPIPAIVFVAWAVIQYSREADEFARRQLNESLAIGFAFGSALVVSYGLLDSFGAPQLSWMFAFAVYMTCWAFGSVVVAMRYRS